MERIRTAERLPDSMRASAFEAVRVLRTVSRRSRLELLGALSAGPQDVSTLAAMVGLSVSITSRHSSSGTVSGVTQNFPDKLYDRVAIKIALLIDRGTLRRCLPA